MRTFACTVLLAMLLANAAAADSRSDVIPMDHWAYAAMDNLSDIGLLGGDSAGYWNVECILLEYPFSPGRTGDEFAEGLEQIIKQYEQEVVSLDHWAYHTLAYFVETGLLPPALQSTFDENHQLSVYEFRQLLLLAEHNFDVTRDFQQLDNSDQIITMLDTLRCEFAEYVIGSYRKSSL